MGANSRLGVYSNKHGQQTNRPHAAATGYSVIANDVNFYTHRLSFHGDIISGYHGMREGVLGSYNCKLPKHLTNFLILFLVPYFFWFILKNYDARV